MQESKQVVNTFEHDGITYYDLSTLKKSELRFLERMPVGHSTFCGDEIYTKVYVLNPANPPRAAFSMVLMSDHSKLIEKQKDREIQFNLK